MSASEVVESDHILLGVILAAVYGLAFILRQLPTLLTCIRFYGMTLYQTFVYARNFTKDPVRTKLLVGGVSVPEVLYLSCIRSGFYG
jgi:arginine exporter protein ArgO